MKVSIIIPVYNAETYIERCVNSVLNQSFIDLEIIAVNDGSTDDSLKKLTELTTVDPRIKIIDKPNEGVVKARSTALKEAAGQYLTFLDADDYLPVGAIDVMVAALEAEDADLCVGSYTLVWAESGRQVLIDHDKHFHDAVGCMKYCLKHGEMFLPIKLYKTDLFKKHVEIPYDVIIQEDTIGLTQYLAHVHRVATTNECVYYYYKHTGSATSIMTKKHVSSLLKVARFLESCPFKATIPQQVDLFRGRMLKACLQCPVTSGDDKAVAQQMFGDLPVSVKAELNIRKMENLLISTVRRLFNNISQKNEKIRIH